MRRIVLAAAAAMLGAALWSAATPARADNTSIGNYFYYPYYYFPANYWPQMSPPWPGPVNGPYMRPPAYMAYPPFKEPHWRYEAFEPQRYYRGFHFWLDAF
jgi:hypothetical protein